MDDTWRSGEDLQNKVEKFRYRNHKHNRGNNHEMAIAKKKWS